MTPDPRIPRDPYHTRPSDLAETPDPLPAGEAFTPAKNHPVREGLLEVAGEAAFEMVFEVIASILESLD